MAVTATCPSCGKPITGTLEDIRRHYGVCVATKARAVAKTEKKDKPAGREHRKADPRAGEKPALNRLTFFIPGMLTSSANNMLHEHVGAAFKDKQRWRDAVDPLLLGFQPAKRRRRLEIVRSAKTVLDKDNLYASAKFLIDAIKTAGALVDDNPKWVDLDVDQKWLPNEGKGMLVTIIDPGDTNADEGRAAEEEAAEEVQAPPHP